MPIDLPDRCLRGYDTCNPLSLIEADDGNSFICCGMNDGFGRAVEQDIFTICFKSSDINEESFCDERDIIHEIAVLSRALAIYAEDKP